VAFTTDLHGRWSKDWIAWEDLERFWGRILEWLIPPKESLPPHEIRVNPEGNHALLDFYLYEEKSGGVFRYSFRGPGGAGEGVLKRLAPGRYQAELPIATPGNYRIELIEERAGRRTEYPPTGYTLAFDPKEEIPRGRLNLPLLEQLARASGGEINPKPQATTPVKVEVSRAAKAYRTHFIFLGLLLLLIDFIANQLLAGRRH
ncbi:MAG: hypothetical protein HYV04_07635, partial [Deltaproteobacteria bacterium]|nr:hypothetical protein [Deltaproteobacteria bacterium]